MKGTLLEPQIASDSKTILLVDDQDEYRLTAKWFLSSFGFVVESVRTPQEALAIFDPKMHDLVVTDNSMPGISGSEMAHIIKLRSPSTPVLLCSGLLPDDRSCLDAVIQKPVPLPALKECVARLLTSPPGEEATNP
jgi:CheY-like chemotaxis protein